jgi:hypothetical protein
LASSTARQETSSPNQLASEVTRSGDQSASRQQSLPTPSSPVRPELNRNTKSAGMRSPVKLVRPKSSWFTEEPAGDLPTSSPGKETSPSRPSTARFPDVQVSKPNSRPLLLPPIGPIPRVDNLRELLATRADSRVSQISTRPLSVDVLSVRSKETAPVDSDRHVFYNTETLAIVVRSKEAGLVSTRLYAWRGTEADGDDPGTKNRLQELAKRYRTEVVRRFLCGFHVVTDHGAYWCLYRSRSRRVGNSPSSLSFLVVASYCDKYALFPTFNG